ncbi:MAG: glutamine--tRNA ligase/YqeY domain fusion protein [Polyangiaceae bacterium]|nr:glutamine--tRNA ligase/YqeY domain fusion protein [Polyangiaceae bacterium]
MSTEPPSKNDFIRQIIQEDRRTGKRHGRVQTRFPPEPNGFLHIGHAKSINLNFGLAKDFEGRCFLRFDDTNPATEDELFIRSIQEDVRWLGFDWGVDLRFASDYFDAIYEHAEGLIKAGKAFVDDLTSDQMRELRGVPGVPGKESPHRNRSVEENLDLFRRMKAGEFPDGSRTLRAKIDMASPNFNMRDPVLYRIKRQPHPKTGTKWVIYPMYDYAHALSDAIEKTTHSICTLEFEDHRPLYDWSIDAIPGALGIDPAERPNQYEFARMEVTYLLTSKRKLKELVETKTVAGWDDPRMPTIAGMRRRGVPAAAFRDFCDRTGVAKAAQMVEIELLDHCIREELDRTAPRVMVVTKPLKVTIETIAAGETISLEAPFHPSNPDMGSRKVALSRDLVIEETDFMMDPPKKFFRLGPGREVRLRYGPIIKCERVVTDAGGNVVELVCSHDPSSMPGAGGEPRKVKGVIHWVSREHGIATEVRNYDRLFAVPNPADVEEGEDFKKNLNPNSLEVLPNALAEASLAGSKPGATFQFERLGYYVVDPDTRPDKLVMNRTVGLRDSWAKEQTKD